MRTYLVGIGLLLGVALQAQANLGVVEAGRYRHVATGTQFNVPSGWMVDGTVPSSDSGEMTALRDPGTDFNLQVWMIKQQIAPEAVAAELDGAPANKLRQRQTGYIIPGGVMSTYRLRNDSIRAVSVGGKSAIEALADYQCCVRIVRGPRPSGAGTEVAVQSSRMVELMTWVISGNTRAFFFGRVQASQMDQYRPWFDMIVQTAVVP